MGFIATPVFSHAAYALVGAGVGIWLLRRRRPADLAVLAMLAAGFAFAASFAVISIACDYRYLYALDLTAIAALFYAVASVGSRSATAAPSLEDAP
jgi:predicted acyltransferase